MSNSINKWNPCAAMLHDITKVVKNEHETALDDRQLAEQDVNSEAALRADEKVLMLEWFLWMLECNYLEELHDRYAEVLGLER